MKTITKNLLVTILALCSILMCTVTVALFNVRATEITVENCDYKLRNGASVRYGIKDGEFDYDLNGIRFMVEMSPSHYNAVKGENVTFGIIVVPYDYIETHGAITEESVFGQGEDQKYNFDGSEGKIKIANFETQELAPYGADKENPDYFYYYASIVNLKPENKARPFYAVAYIKESVDLGDGFMVDDYRFITPENESDNVRSMSYVVQKEIDEQDDNALLFAEELREKYIAGVNEEVTINLSKSYDGSSEITSTATLDFALDTVLDAEKVTKALKDAKIIDDKYELDASKANVDGVKVYHNGFTADVNVYYTVKEAPATDYAAIKGLYECDGKTVAFLSNKTFEANGEEGEYKLFADGTVKSVIGDKTYLGSYDLNKGTLNIKVEQDVLKYVQIVELGAQVYDQVAGYYFYEGKLVKLFENGKVEYGFATDSEQNGAYVIAYDESNGKTYVIISLANSSIVKELTAGVIAGFETATIASQAQYTEFAQYYTEKTSNNIYRFFTDGTIEYQGENCGKYALFADGTIIAKINDDSLSGTFTPAKNVNVVFAVYNTIQLSNSDESVNYTLVHIQAKTYDIYEVFSSTEGVVYKPDSTTRRIYLYPEKSPATKIGSKTLTDGHDGTNQWYKAKYDSRYGSVKFDETKVAYRLEVDKYENGVPVGGKFIFGKSDGTNSNSSFEIKDGKLYIHLAYDPNDGTLNPKVTFTSTTIPEIGEKGAYDIYASSIGVKYTNSKSSSLILYNTPTTITHERLDKSYSWYEAEWYQGSSKTHSKTQICYTLIPKAEDGSYGQIKLFANNYSITAVIYYGTINGVRYIDTNAYDANSDNYKGRKTADKVNLTNMNNEIPVYGQKYNIVKENVGIGEQSTFDIYADIAGYYNSKKYYDNSDNIWHSIGFTLKADKTTAMSVGDTNYTGEYKLIPHNDTFGEILFTPGYASNGNYDQTGTFRGYYSKINGEYILRMSMTPAGVNYWHFIDFTKSTSTFSSWNVYDEIVEKGSSSIYTDDNASLELFALTGKGIVVNGNSKNYEGGKFAFTKGSTVVNGTYDFIATSLTAGKVFLDFHSTPGWNNSTAQVNAIRYVIGDYALIGSEYVLFFTYNGVDYVMTLSGNLSTANTAMINTLKGNYVGTANQTFTITDNAQIVMINPTEGVITENGITAKYSIQDGRILVAYTTAGNDIIAVKLA